MTTQQKPKKEISPGFQKRINDYNRGRGFRFIYDIYPDYWKKEWGDKPHLGSVRADSEFDAIRAAYDYRLLPYNFTFGPKAVKRKFKESKPGKA